MALGEPGPSGRAHAGQKCLCDRHRSAKCPQSDYGDATAGARRAVSLSWLSGVVTRLSRAGFSAFREVAASDEPGKGDHRLRRLTLGSRARLSDTAACGLEAFAMFLVVFLAATVRKVKMVQKGRVFRVRHDSTAALPATDKLPGKSVVTSFDAVESVVSPEVRGVGEIDVLHSLDVLNKTMGWLTRRSRAGQALRQNCHLKGVRRRPVSNREGSLRTPCPLPHAGVVGPCQLKSSSRASIRERSW